MKAFPLISKLSVEREGTKEELSERKRDSAKGRGKEIEIEISLYLHFNMMNGT